MSASKVAGGKQKDMRGASLPDLSRRSRSKRNQDSQGARQDGVSDNSGRQDIVNPSKGGMGNGDVRKRVSGTEGEENRRFRVQTQLGVEYNKPLHDKNRKRSKKRIEHIAKSLDPLFNSYDNVEMVKGKLLELDQNFADLIESHGKYHILINDSREREESSMWMNDIDNFVFGFKQFANDWLKKSVTQTLLNENRSVTGNELEQTDQELQKQQLQQLQQQHYEYEQQFQQQQQQQQSQQKHFEQDQQQQQQQHFNQTSVTNENSRLQP